MRFLVLAVVCFSTVAKADFTSDLAILSDEKATHPQRKEAAERLQKEAEFDRGEMEKFETTFRKASPKIQPLMLLALYGRQRLSVPAERFITKLLYPRRYFLSTPAAYVAANLVEIRDPGSRDRLVQFALRSFPDPIPQSVSINYALPTHVFEERQRNEDLMDLAWYRRHLIARIVGFIPHREYAAKALMKVALEDSDEYARSQAVITLGAEKLLTDEHVDKILADFEWRGGLAQGAVSEDFALSLLGLITHVAERHPMVERLVLPLLEHPSNQIRSEVIDTLRTHKSLKDPRALADLTNLAPRLTGYAANVAQELLVATGSSSPTFQDPAQIGNRNQTLGILLGKEENSLAAVTEKVKRDPIYAAEMKKSLSEIGVHVKTPEEIGRHLWHNRVRLNGQTSVLLAAMRNRLAVMEHFADPAAHPDWRAEPIPYGTMISADDFNDINRRIVEAGAKLAVHEARIEKLLPPEQRGNFTGMLDHVSPVNPKKLVGALSDKIPDLFTVVDASNTFHPAQKVRVTEQPVFLRLMVDSFDEVKQFGELSGEARERFLQFEDNLWDHSQLDRFEKLSELSWGHVTVKIPEGEPPATAADAALKGVTPRFTTPDPAYVHSMPDLAEYLKARLGMAAVSEVNSGHATVEVFGGFLSTLMKERNLSNDLMARIPSPYADWGIEKYIDFSVRPPRLFFVVPPNEQYVQHYASMLQNLNVKKAAATLSLRDRDALKKQFHDAANEAVKKIGVPPDSVLLGYDYAWLDAIRRQKSWSVANEGEVEVACGPYCHVTVKYADISHAAHPLAKKRLYFVGSKKTLWGEASVHLLEGFAKAAPNLGEVIFAGSAGSPGTSLIYGVSVPSQFIDASGNPIAVKNYANYNRMSVDAAFESYERSGGEWMETSGSYRRKKRATSKLGADVVPMVLFSTHGWSSSPAEQSRRFVSEHYDERNIHTIDVETNLIAKFVEQHNAAHPGKPLKLSVAHLITDNPASDKKTVDQGSTLTGVDRQRKAAARDLLLHELLERFEQRVHSTKRNCEFGALAWE